VNVVANDSDVDGDALAVVAVTAPLHGSAAILGNGAVTYSPAAGWAGTDTFTYTVSDGAASAVATVSVTVVDNVAPAVAIESPAAGSNLAGQVTVRAGASDNVGVVRVELYRDGGVLLAALSAPPFETTWNTAGVTPGGHTLHAMAFDAAGNAATSPTVTVTVQDQVPPTVAITSPSNGGTVNKNTTITVAASASDNVGVTRVEIFDGTTLICTDTSSPYSCAWRTPKKAGVVSSLQAKAYDARGNMASSAVVRVTTR
jgi:hypothetical protein